MVGSAAEHEPSEYDLTGVTEWPEEEWKNDYPGVSEFISEFMLTQKKEHTELLPMIQLLTPVPVREKIEHLSTDGEHLYYSPIAINEYMKRNPDSYKIDDKLPLQLMHIVMHGFLGQFGAYYEDEELAWAVMDLLAERFSYTYLKPRMNLLGHPRIPTDGKLPMGKISRFEKKQRDFSEESKHKTNEDRLEELLEKGMGAYYTIKKMKKSRLFVIRQGKEACSDNHRLWKTANKKKWDQAAQDIMNGLPPELQEMLRQMNKDSAAMTQGSPGDRVQQISIQTAAVKSSSGEQKSGSRQTGSPGMRSLDMSALSLVVASVRSTNSDAYGLCAGDGGMSVTAEKDSTMSYSEALRDICMEKDQIHEEPDSIDPMFYQHGMDLYGDMPLIESLEENPYPSIDNLVLAIDTSGSCGGGIAKRFINETCKILSDADELGHVGAVTLLQCDTRIRDVREFETGKELAELLDKPMQLSGFGGTSFVPVFDWIEKNHKLKGKDTAALIYLTDGDGIYPEKKPDYPTYFVVPDDEEWVKKRVKSWIQVLSLDKKGGSYI